MNKGELNIKATVDTTELEKALQKVYELHDLTERTADMLGKLNEMADQARRDGLIE